MTGLFRAIAYMHGEKDMIHRDLKPGNIVISNYKDLTQIKLIDFGTSTKN
jgi:serine/threonine protein kinase